jgi:aconitate hydratase
VRAVLARSFERIHRSNLVGMGVLTLQFKGSDSWESLGIRGDERFDIDVPADMKPQQDIVMTIHAADGSSRTVTLASRIDTPIEIDYYRHGGILPYVLRELMAA